MILLAVGHPVPIAGEGAVTLLFRTKFDSVTVVVDENEMGVASTTAVYAQYMGAPGLVQTMVPFTDPTSVMLLVLPRLTYESVPMQFEPVQPLMDGGDCAADALQLKPLKPEFVAHGLFEKHTVGL